MHIMAPIRLESITHYTTRIYADCHTWPASACQYKLAYVHAWSATNTMHAYYIIIFMRMHLYLYGNQTYAE